MVRLVHTLRRVASGATIAGLLSLAAHADERFSALRLDQLTPEQQQMAVHLKTPPRNSELNGGPFYAYARTPRPRPLLLQVGDYVRFHSSPPPRLSEFAIMIAPGNGRSPTNGGHTIRWRSKAASTARFSSTSAPAHGRKA